MICYVWLWGGGEIKCPCTEKHEIIKMGKTQRKEGMSCNRKGKAIQRDREEEVTEGRGG